MDLRQLRYFCQVVESGSFSKAADILHVAQPALSQHVRRMEDELGVALLHRTPHGVTTTEAGDRLLRHAKRIISEFSELPDQVRGALVAPRGEVRFGMPATIGELLAVPLIEAAKERYPEVRIRIVEAMSGYVLGWLRRGDLDLAILYGTSDPGGLASHHGLSEEIRLFASSSIPQEPSLNGDVARLSALGTLPVIIPGRGHGLRELVEEAILERGKAFVPAIEIDSYTQIKRLVARGLGYGILPHMAIDREVETGVFRMWRFEEPRITRRLYLTYSTERPLLTAPRAIGQLAWEILRNLVAEGLWIGELSDDEQDPRLYP